MNIENFIPGTKTTFDANDCAKKVIACHMNSYLHGCHAEYESNNQMMDDMYNECAFILTNDMIEGKLTPMQIAAVRNELMDMIWNIFKDYINAENETEHAAFLADIKGTPQ